MGRRGRFPAVAPDDDAIKMTFETPLEAHRAFGHHQRHDEYHGIRR